MASPNPLQRTRPIVHLPLMVLAVLFLTPLLWLFSASLQPREQVGKVPPELLPRQHYIERAGERIYVTPPQLLASGKVVVNAWQLGKVQGAEARSFEVDPSQVRSEIKPVLGNYSEAIRVLASGDITFFTYLSNTLLVAVLSVLGTVLSSALAAYGLARVAWKGREGLFSLTLSTMMVPFPVLMIPLYSVFRALGWIGTLLPLWVPACFGGAFSIFLLRQFFLTIPSELSEAARIDGCSELTIFWRVLLPLAKPALSVVALFQFLFVWNDFLGPLIYLSQPETFTMALGLQQYQSQSGGSESHLLMAASALLVLPILLLFFLAQKTFIQGISTTGMGGR
jgi:multiple sugar transport system permease protein